MKLDLSIKQRLVSICALSLALLAGVGCLAYLAIAKLSAANEASAVYADALRHHLEVDMFHEGLTGVVTPRF